MARILLSAHGYELAANPEYGANLTGLTWRDAAGREVPILRACADNALVPGQPSPVGCFPMAPFANRIDGGIFEHGGSRHVLPVNRPDEQVAIHGLSRFEPFEVIARSEAGLSLLHRHCGHVFGYDLTQTVTIDQAGVMIGLDIVNRGAEMPFGCGLHPYFAQEIGARLRFEATHRSLSNERYLPVEFVAAGKGPDFAGGAGLAQLEGFDAHYAGWRSSAVLERPLPRIAVTVSASGAFSNLHVFVPPGGELVCIEPVSHVPDVHNRRALAGFGDVAVLAPGASLTGRMRVAVQPLTGR